MDLIGFGLQVLKKDAAGGGGGKDYTATGQLKLSLSIAAKAAMQIRANGYGIGVSIAAQAKPVVLYYYWTGDNSEITSGQPWKHQPWNDENFTVFDQYIDKYGTAEAVRLGGYGTKKYCNVITNKKAYRFSKFYNDISVAPIVNGEIGGFSDCGTLPIGKRINEGKRLFDNEQYILIRNDIQNRLYILGLCDPDDKPNKYVEYGRAGIYTATINSNGEIGEISKTDIAAPWFNYGGDDDIRPDLRKPDNEWIGERNSDWALVVANRLYVFRNGAAVQSWEFYPWSETINGRLNIGNEPPGELAWMDILEDGTLSGVWHHRRIKTARWDAAYVYVRAQNRNCHDRIYRISGSYTTDAGFSLTFTPQIAYIEIDKDGNILTDFYEEAVGFIPTHNLQLVEDTYVPNDGESVRVRTGSTGKYLTIKLNEKCYICSINQDASINQPIPTETYLNNGKDHSYLNIGCITKSRVYGYIPKDEIWWSSSWYEDGGRALGIIYKGAGIFNGGSDNYLKYTNETSYTLPRISLSAGAIQYQKVNYVIPTESVKDFSKRWEKDYFTLSEWEKDSWDYPEIYNYHTLFTISAKAEGSHARRMEYILPHYHGEYIRTIRKLGDEGKWENEYIYEECIIKIEIQSGDIEYEPPEPPEPEDIVVGEDGKSGIRYNVPKSLYIHDAIGGKPGYNGGNFELPFLRLTAMGVYRAPGALDFSGRYKLPVFQFKGAGVFTEPADTGIHIPLITVSGFAAPGKSSTIDYCLPSIKIQSRKPDFWPINEIRGQIYRLPVLRIKGKGRVQMQGDDWQGYILPRLHVQVRDESNAIDPQDRIAFGGHMRRGWLFRPCPVYGKSIFSPAVLSLQYTLPLQASIQAEGRPPLTAEDTADAEWWVLKFHREEMF